MSEVKIKKAKIKDDLFLEVEYSEDLPGHSKKDTKLTCTIPVHDDMKAAFARLDKHLALLCDDLPCKHKSIDKWDDPVLTGYAVRGFSIGGSGDSEGCTISGAKEAKHGFVNLVTPHQQWEGSEYKFISDMASDVQACVYEVEQYLFEGKRAPETQMAMDFGEETQGEHEEE